MAEEKPIIVIKKKGGHGGHHGGAWKIAYADFVTAMMAFFMVMWLLNSASTPVKQSIASYFRKPGLFTEGSGTPLEIGGAGILPDAYVPPHPENEDFSSGRDQSPQLKKSGNEDDPEKNKQLSPTSKMNRETTTGIDKEEGAQKKDVKDAMDQGEMAEAIERKKLLDTIAEQIRQEVLNSPELEELLGLVDVKVDADGLNIEIMDTEKTSMFSSGSARILPAADAAFSKLAGILGKLPNSVEILGHTDGHPFSNRKGGYSNWELSSDRANAARRLLEQVGYAPERIKSVVGRADKELRKPEDPFAASNRRITLKMKFDFDKKIDLSKDPKGLDNMDRLKQDAQKEHESAAKAASEKEKVHSLTPKEIIDGGKHPKLEKLPDEERTMNPDVQKKDKIFGDNPVIGPPNPFGF